jgi:hypothetical protein
MRIWVMAAALLSAPICTFAAPDVTGAWRVSEFIPTTKCCGPLYWWVLRQNGESLSRANLVQEATDTGTIDASGAFRFDKAASPCGPNWDEGKFDPDGMSFSGSLFTSHDTGDGCVTLAIRYWTGTRITIREAFEERIVREFECLGKRKLRKITTRKTTRVGKHLERALATTESGRKAKALARADELMGVLRSRLLATTYAGIADACIESSVLAVDSMRSVADLLR